MTKPLELTVYPKYGSLYIDEPSGAAWTSSMVDGLAAEKSLTDAELAAEYWQSGYADMRYDREDEDLEPIPEIIHRFAVLPHAADNGYE